MRLQNLLKLSASIDSIIKQSGEAWTPKNSKALPLIQLVRSKKNTSTLTSSLESLQDHLSILFTGDLGAGDETAKETVLFASDFGLDDDIQVIASDILTYRVGAGGLSRVNKINNLYDITFSLVSSLKIISEEKDNLIDIDDDGFDISLARASKIMEVNIKAIQELAFQIYNQADLLISEIEGDIISIEEDVPEPLGIQIEDPGKINLDVGVNYPGSFTEEEYKDFEFPSLFKKKTLLSFNRLNYFRKLAYRL